MKFKNRWHIMLYLEVLQYAFGSSILVYLLSSDLLFAILAFFVIAVITSLFIKPWKPSLESSTSFIDQRLELAEYSSGLLLKPTEQLSSLAQLQQIRISNKLRDQISNLTPPNHLLRAGLIALALILLGFASHRLGLFQDHSINQNPDVQNTLVQFEPIDSLDHKSVPPKLENQLVTIQYPKYTNRKAYNSTSMNIKVLEGSRAFWRLNFDQKVNHVTMRSSGTDHLMSLKSGSYAGSSVLRNSGFYNFKFTDTLGNEYSSDLYSIEVVPDRSPSIEITGIEQFTSFDFEDSKEIRFKALVNDDYGLANAQIVATVSKGSGESVKFREQTIAFDTPIKNSSKTLELSKTLDLDNLKMEPGDELYFYVEAMDLKKPTYNRSRSETHFAVIKDTTTYDFEVEGNLGVDRMPDYFRSQRQLIIDTKKLISNKGNLTTDEFKYQSNELGYDQKALRLKYAEFMGEEEDSGLDISDESVESLEQEMSNEEDEDPLAEYTHDHDGDNEHNLVEEEDEDSKNPLAKFLHDHDDPEEATLFSESLKTKLRNALNEMWDAELYLRLYEPSNSLPYQYRALELIQEIKNSARIYVHRIGFDPPPIKEEKRLSGKLEDITSFRKSETKQMEETFPSIKSALKKLESMTTEDYMISEEDQIIFEQAGNELATEAIKYPGKYLTTLQLLKRVSEGTEQPKSTIEEIRKGLFMVLPTKDMNPYKESATMDDLNRQMLKELNIND